MGNKIAGLCSTGDPQAGRYISLARRKECTEHEDQKMVPTRRGEPDSKGRQPFVKDVGNRVAPVRRGAES